MPSQVEVKFSAHLKRFVDLPEVHRSHGDTVKDIVDDLERNYPGVSNYLLHENGKLRQHVNLFLDDQLMADRDGLSDSVAGIKTVFVMQALSGG